MLAPLAVNNRVIVPDLPGLGASAPVDPLDLPTLDRWLHTLIDKTCDSPPAVVAHSAPAAMVTRCASNGSAFLRRLILVGAVGLAPFRPTPRLLTAIVPSVALPSRRTLGHLLRAVTYDLDQVRREDPDGLDAFERYAAARAADVTVRRTMRQIVRGGTKRIPDEDLARITAPTTLLWGRHDPLSPLSNAESASARLGWPLQVIADAGHLPHVERPDAFLAALRTAAG